MSSHPKNSNFDTQATNPTPPVKQQVVPSSFPTNYYQTFPGFSIDPFLPYANPYHYQLFYNPYRHPLYESAHFTPFYPQQENFIHQLKPHPNASLQNTMPESPEVESNSSSEESKGRHSKDAVKRSTQGKMVEGSRYKISKKGKKNFTSYYWSLEENKRYSEFLKLHPELFDLSVSQKKNLRVNVMMSKKIKSRTPQQCHSHHQKMVKKYGNIENIIVGLRDEREQILEGKKLARDQVKDQVEIE